jgi:nitroreductase
MTFSVTVNDLHHDIFDAIYQRRSVHDFLPGAIPPRRIKELIAAAVQAPSPMNQQHWSFHVIHDRAVLKKCSDLAKAHVLAGLAEGSPFWGLRKSLADPKFNIFHNAPALVVICATHDDELSKQACCLAAENLMLAAWAQGLGSCWVDLAEDWFKQPQTQDFLGIPATVRAVAPIVLGRPRLQPAAPERRIPDVNWIPAA